MDINSRTDLLNTFYDQIADCPERIIIGDDYHAFTAGSLIEQVQTFREHLKANVDSEQAVVAFAVSSSALALIIELAIWEEGHIAMSLPPILTTSEANNFLSSVCPQLLIIESPAKQGVWVGAASHLTLIFLVEDGVICSKPNKEVPAVECGSNALQIQFTSGSSGKPKALVFDVGAVAAGIQQSLHWYKNFPAQAAFSSLPHYHAMGRAVIFECLWSGRNIFISNTMAIGNHQKCILENQCGLILSNPTYIRLGLQVGFWKKLTCVNQFILGTSLVESDLPPKIHEQIPNAIIDIRYGVSESFGALTRLSVKSENKACSAGYVGKPLLGVEIDILNDALGSVVAKTKAMATMAIECGVSRNIRNDSGYISTGDIGSVDESGGLILHGRSNVFIKHRGYRIDPIEIESTVLDYNNVLDAIVVGMPDDNEGEKIIAIIETKTPEVFDVSGLAMHCKEALSSYKQPSKIVCVESLLRKPSGKPDRQANLEQLIFKSNSIINKECQA